jgi:hypothetical protein
MSARTRRERAKSLKRTVEKVPVRRTFRVYAEGISTEPEYIDAIRRTPEVAAVVSIAISIEHAGASPMTLVEAACADKRRDSLEVDFYWCVFDVESPQPHPNLDRARQMARDNDINLAVSNPCFELWLVLHHQDQTAYLTTSAAVALRARLDGSEGKHLDQEFYVARRAAAARRAATLRRKHHDDATEFPHDNPSSSFDLFIASVLSQAAAATSELGDPF